jgi:thioredoxin-like negative regulator of GroEL
MVWSLQDHRTQGCRVRFHPFSAALTTEHRLTQHFHRYSGTYKNAAFFKLDVDKVEDVAGELGVRAMPTFMIFKDGEKVAEVVGANPAALNAAIKANVSEKEGA